MSNKSDDGWNPPSGKINRQRRHSQENLGITVLEQAGDEKSPQSSEKMKSGRFSDNKSQSSNPDMDEFAFNKLGKPGLPQVNVALTSSPGLGRSASHPENRKKKFHRSRRAISEEPSVSNQLLKKNSGEY